MTKPRMAVVSHVYPFPGSAGQQQRVRNKLQAFRESFHVTFITIAGKREVVSIAQKLQPHCDEVVILPSLYHSTPWAKIGHRLWGGFWAWRTGVKFSNYLVGQVEFHPARMAKYLSTYDFDVVVFEYWHAAATTAVFRAQGIPCVLDMHDVLWQAYARQLLTKRLPDWYKQKVLHLYQQHEERAWSFFDGIIAINAAEYNYVHEQLPSKQLFYAPMGIDLEKWPYDWSPVTPPRIVYYGSLGSEHNQRDAWHCYADIMPKIWACYPEAELWLVGNNPPPYLQQLPTSESRVHVTGFVDNVQAVLATASLVLCPWTGKYGFRSRLIEAMSLGIPVVTTPDAVYGMNLLDQRGILQGDSDEQLAQQVLRLLSDQAFATVQSQLAHQVVMEQYSFASTYQRLATELMHWVTSVKHPKGEVKIA